MGERIRECGSGICPLGVILGATCSDNGWHSSQHSYPLEVVTVGVILVERELLWLLHLGWRLLLLLLFEEVGGKFHCPQSVGHIWQSVCSGLDLKFLENESDQMGVNLLSDLVTYVDR